MEIYVYNIIYIYILMNSKSKSIYRQALSVLRTRVNRSQQRSWKPKQVVMDFELSLQQAWEEEFPDCRIISCYFHYVKAIWSRAATLGKSLSILLSKA